MGLEILVNGFLQIGRAYGAEKCLPMRGEETRLAIAIIHLAIETGSVPVPKRGWSRIWNIIYIVFVMEFV